MRKKQVTFNTSSHFGAHTDARRRVSGITGDKEERKWLKRMGDEGGRGR